MIVEKTPHRTSFRRSGACPSMKLCEKLRDTALLLPYEPCFSNVSRTDTLFTEATTCWPQCCTLETRAQALAVVGRHFLSRSAARKGN